MTDVVIKVEQLAKRYLIGTAREPYLAARDVLVRGLRKLGRGLLGRKTERVARSEEFWALRDASFEVRRGECVGIIGRNGAGKSTLLKLLSRITEPTAGEIRLRGRVGSLLEVGTGFHPELTGRENITLNGAILGMSRKEIARKFDEIVAFADVEKFLDTPVKYYSSGMYTRLAFAVAAHLEPDILVVDEVLAVGDAQFQKKCLGKMGEIARGGRTVLFVSHHLASIEALTNRCLLLDSGRIKAFDRTPIVTDLYLSSSASTLDGVSLKTWRNRKQAPEGAEIVKFECQDDSGGECHFFRPRTRLRMRLGVQFSKPMLADLAIVVETSAEFALFTTHLSDRSALRELFGYHEFAVELADMPLRQGRYLVSLAVGTPQWTNSLDAVFHFPAFDIDGRPEQSDFPLDNRWGPLYFELPWASA